MSASAPAYVYRRAAIDAEHEAAAAAAKWPAFNSPHEGVAVIAEELAELWEHVRGNTARTAAARTEAIHVAAMAIRFAAELCQPEGSTTE